MISAALVAIGLLAIAGMSLAGAAVHSGAATQRLACPQASVSIAVGQGVSAMTGEHAVGLVVTNKGHNQCLLIGYPAVVIRAGTRALPFTYDEGGGMYVSSRSPSPIELGPGGHAAFLVAKYRCDVGDLQAGTAVTVWLPGVVGSWSVALPRPYSEGLVLCRKAKRNGPPDPGNTIIVSPLEAGTFAR